MFLFLQEQAQKAAEQVEQAPILVKLVNQYFGQTAYDFEMKYTYPFWQKFLAKFGSTPEAAFGPYTPENAIPWYTVMFVVACILSLVVIWMLKGRLSEEEPGPGQQTLEVGVLAVRSMLEDILRVEEEHADDMLNFLDSMPGDEPASFRDPSRRG